LRDIDYLTGRMDYRAAHETQPESVLASYLEEARRIVRESVRQWQGKSLQEPELPDEYHRLRWYPLPSEVLAKLQA
jgi:hypothetical protein